MSLLPFENRTSASLICHLRKDIQGIVHALKTEFPELQIKEYYSKSNPVEKACDFSNLLNVKCECLSRELQNRGIFPDTDSIIWNKNVPTASMEISIIEFISKSDENIVLLSQAVKANFLIIKAEEISDLTNTNILDYETAEFLENKLKKTLKEMHSLDRHCIVDCYQIQPELLTKEFISKYGNYNHIKWFKAYRQLQDAGTNNEMAVEAISSRDIDNRSRYKADNVKMCLNSPGFISYLQNLVPKMARVFDNTDVSCSVKKSGLKTIRAKLGLLNSALHVTYKLKFKAIDKGCRYYYLVGSFDSNNTPALPLYQTEKKIY
ncbi:13394_t:CDS:2 [Cetraspora pellucida]|uniref:13394_t:CDS:1 n=1 Tax=Cetraspora pellucida TaxID=1433469 RepID=A0A9N9FDY2_9GLOM|nr:13394_t:CDS:2 [Cetraspora pellucida]